MKSVVMRGLLAISLPLALVGGAVAAEKVADVTKSDPGATCAEMMRESSAEGRKPMANMMEMMGSMGGGGMMGGQGGMMQPGGAHPGK